MEWFTGNVFFIVIFVLCIVMHVFMHGGHGDHGRQNPNGDAPRHRTPRA